MLCEWNNEKGQASTHLGEADPVGALQVLALHAQPRGLVGVDVELLVPSRGAAGGDGLLEPAAAPDLEGADALVALVELDVEADDVLGLLEPVGDLALGVVELLAARPPGGVGPVLVAREGGGAAVGVASPFGREPGVVDVGPLVDGSGFTRVLESCVVDRQKVQTGQQEGGGVGKDCKQGDWETAHSGRDRQSRASLRFG